MELRACGRYRDAAGFARRVQGRLSTCVTLRGLVAGIGRSLATCPAAMVGFLVGLFVGVIPAGAAELRVTTPVDYQVIQRRTVAEGSVPVAGILVDVPQGGVIEARLQHPAFPGNGWQRVATVPPGATQFKGQVAAQAGGWFKLEVRLRGGGGERVAEVAEGANATVEHVGVGEVFVVAGQSNSANHGEEKQRSASGLVSSWSGSRWQLAADPMPGASGNGGSFLPPFGDLLAARCRVPIGLVAVGVGATSVREWLPRGAPLPNPPTLTGNVVQLPSGQWASRGNLYSNLAARLRPFGPRGFRAVLWHQGESDANQTDATRTLAGTNYEALASQLIRSVRQDLGWACPWFVAQASYHTPADPGSPEIRAAQAALWRSGLAWEGPDTDALTGPLRDNGGQGVHFSGPGLRAHAERWVDKVIPWLEKEWAQPNRSPVNGPTPRLQLPGMEDFVVAGRPAFVFLPAASLRTNPQPWIFYAPTLPGYPDGAERWMHEQFLAAGVAVAGVDVGEAYGSPASHGAFEALYQELTTRRGFALQPCLFGRSRGGLWVSSWALAHPQRVAGLIGVYPVFDFRTYPGIAKAAPAYGLSASELEARADELNPVARLGELARAGVPVALIHGDQDVVVPLRENSGQLLKSYEAAAAADRVRLIVLPGQGHNFHEGFFQSQELVDFAITRARAGARK